MVDLRTCKKGDTLISKHGMKLKYVGELSEEDYYDHFVSYPNGSLGTRTDSGYVYDNPESRMQHDHDIVEIIHN